MTLPYALDVTEVGAMQPVLTLDEALQIVDDKYNSIIMEGNYKIDKIENRGHSLLKNLLFYSNAFCQISRLVHI